jgi:F-type H+-transporting ATPase subunit delta
VADDSKVSNVGGRYAQALFDLARDEGQVAAVEADLKSLKAALRDSKDLRVLVGSPAFSAEDKGKGLVAIAVKAKFSMTTIKFLGLLASNGRASLLPSIITSFEALSAKARGAVSALVTTAVALSAAQSKGVAAALRQALGKDPEIETHVDPAILGGIKVQVGSRLFDASLKSKLDSLKFALKRA